MNAADDDVDDDGSEDATNCLVCGEPLAGRAYLALSVFAVVAPQGDAIAFPSADGEIGLPPDARWADLPLDRAVHLRMCAQAYFDGVLADIRHQRRQADAQEQP